MTEDKKKKNIILISLIAVIIILLGIVVFFLMIKPSINNYVVQVQNEAIQYAVLSIAQQASTCKTVSLPIGNQTMDIIWTKCLQQTTQ